MSATIDAPAWELKIRADRDYFDTWKDAGHTFPSYPRERTFPLELAEVTFGRHDPDKGVDPDIDLQALNGDPVISRLHAILLRQPDGSYALVDPGSKNGTWLNRGSTEIPKQTPVPLVDGDEFHVGMWTTVTLHAREPSFTEPPRVTTAPVTAPVRPRTEPPDVTRADVVWLVCADIEDSSALLHRAPGTYDATIAQYQRQVTETCAAHRGRMISLIADTGVMRLSGPQTAVEVAVALHAAFDAPPFSTAEVGVRIGIHVETETVAPPALRPVSTGEAIAVCLAAHGGQVIVSEAAQPEVAAAVGDDVSLEGLGPHRLSDLQAPQELYQLRHPTLAADFPPPYSLDRRPNNLPVRFTKFIGRSTEIERLRGLIADNRLCTLTGSGGTGKTSLALQVAAQDLESFPGGVWFADLSDLVHRDEDHVAAAVAAALGIEQGSSGTYAPGRHETRGATERIVDQLRHRKVLLVLDRCEHVVTAAARLVDELLRECSATHVLVTSREALRLPGEAVLHVGPLEPPASGASLAEVRECASVRLFIDRALLQKPDLELSDEAIQQMASICQRLDGIPYAVELAAARTNMLAIAQIADMLDELVIAPPMPGSSHHPLVQATIQWSYDLLDQRQQTLLCRLSVFAGGFTLDAARSVCRGDDLAPDEILDLLTDLVAKSLVELEPQANANHYRLLETTRQYASERLAHSGEEEAIRLAHLEWFLLLVEGAAVELTGPHQGAFLDRLEADHENLRAAFRTARQRGAGEDLRLAASLPMFWLVRGLISEGLAWLDEALGPAPGAVSSERAQALDAAALLACFSGDYERARHHADEGLTIARDLGDDRGQAYALSALGIVAAGEGRNREAAERHNEAIAISRGTTDAWHTAFALNNLGNVLALQGDLAEARSCYEESLSLRREHGDTWGTTWALFRLGMLTIAEGDDDLAVALLEEALATSRGLRFRQGTLLALLGLGEALHRHGSPDEATERYAEALTTARQLEEPAVACLALAGLADVALATGRTREAVTHLSEEEAINTEPGPATRAVLTRSRAGLAAAQGNDQGADDDHRSALVLFHQLGDCRATVEEVEALAIVALRLGQPLRSACLLAAAEAARERIGLPVPTIDRVSISEAVDLLRGRDDEATRAAWHAGEVLSWDEAVSLAASSVITADEEPATVVTIVETVAPDAGHLETALHAWLEDLRRALAETEPPSVADEIVDRYRAGFPTAYWTTLAPAAAAADLLAVEHGLRLRDLPIDCSLRPGLEPTDGLLDLRLFCPDRIAVADVLPVLDNFGLRILDEHLYDLRPEGSPPRWIHDFGLAGMDGAVDPDDRTRFSRFEEAFTQVWLGHAESDGFNRLVLAAGLEWRDVTVLRAYGRYLLQIKHAFGQAYMERTLAGHPEIARRLVGLFHLRFRPDGTDPAERAAATGRLAGEITAAIDQLASLDEDRVLRQYLHLIQATVRTNFFQLADGRPKDRLALKFDPSGIPELPLPRPAAEIFVYSPRVEGVHLRGGKVARGGIRWSDRLEDFRTEVLGLMKAQTVKNVVILPVGAKGGFVVKQPPSDAESRPAEGIECYRTFISGLLDLTDNLVDGSVVGPPDIVRHDGDDPYLVVAADKGTATFSDLANGISGDYGFWLGDAFASGGSAGYDHKGIGITSRGAWESVRCHFRSLGIDADAEEITVVGIGDMSGDVFGNGMLRSRHLKVVGAFDHRHIFLDPNPDPERSYAERQRLFALPRSSWADYDPALISEGGGTHRRDARSIPLSAPLQALLGVEVDALTPDEVAQALLRAPVDLLWNGGVGTFFKATAESAVDVGDRSNDAIRVDAAEVRSRVACEGGNLGWTQRARVEFARRGGLINTDAIDNSAGVDCSDHEVNLKLALDPAVGVGHLSRADRDSLLTAVTDEVAELCLRDNRWQTRALSRNRSLADRLGAAHLLTMRYLEQVGTLDRDLESLPSDAELDARVAAGEGLVLPELAVLLAHAKIHVFDEVLASDLPEDPFVGRELPCYFPARLVENFPDGVDTHPLRREIMANAVANDLLNRMDLTFPFRVCDHGEVSMAAVVRAYLIACEVLSVRDVWHQIEAVEGLPLATENELLSELNTGIEAVTRWMLRRGTPTDIAELVARHAHPVADLASELPGLLAPAERERFEARVDGLRALELPPELAHRLAVAPTLAAGPDIAEIADETGQPTRVVAAVYLALEDQFELRWLRDQVEALPADRLWEMRYQIVCRDDLDEIHRNLTTAVVAGPEATSSADPDELLQRWLADHRGHLAAVEQHVRELRTGGGEASASLGIALRELLALSQAAGARQLAGTEA